MFSRISRGSEYEVLSNTLREHFPSYFIVGQWHFPMRFIIFFIVVLVAIGLYLKFNANKLFGMFRKLLNGNENTKGFFLDILSCGILVCVLFLKVSLVT